MPTKTKFDFRATVLCGAAAVIAGSTALVAQTVAPSLPNFIDARPLPQTDRGRQDEIEARRKADDELKRLTAEADAKRRADEETKRVAAEADAKRRADDEKRRMAAEADARNKADDDAKRVAAEADAKRLATESDAKHATDLETRRLAAETEAKRVAAETETKRLAAEAESKRAAEAEAKRVADAEQRRVAAENDVKRAAADAETKRAADAETRRIAAETEQKRVAAEADAKRKADEETRRATAALVRPDAQKIDTARAVIRGRQLMAEGDFGGARLVLDRAALAGDADAALALADTFDLTVLNRNGVVGVTADAALAKYWRSRAQELSTGTATPPVAASPGAIAATATRAAPPTQASTPIPTPTPVPAPTPRAATPVTPPLPTISADAQRFIARGRSMLQQGDIDAARLFFERAVNAGAAEGALELGATYDPVALKELGVVGLLPDPTRAAVLYRQAQQMGAVGAAERLARLGVR